MWQKDEDISYCNLCKNEFSMFLRKHHCRACGKIFCYKCIVYNKSKTRYILCNKCNANLQYKNILRVLKIAKIYDLRDLKSLGMVNRHWNKITKIIINDFYSIQFNLNPLSSYERDLLCVNRKYISGHFNYLYKGISMNTPSNYIDIFNDKKMVNCRNLRCRNCTECNIDNYICLLNNPNSFRIYSRKILESVAPRKEFIFYICSNFHKFITNVKDNLFDSIITVCRRDEKAPIIFFWSLENLSYIYSNYYEFYQTIRNQIFVKYTDPQKQTIKDIYNFIDLMKSVDITNSHDINYNLINSYLHTRKPTYVFNYKYHLLKLLDISVKNSNSKPTIYTFKTDSSDNTSTNVSFLLKKEDIQIDLIIINCINFTKKLLKNIIPEDTVVTYNVLPYKNKFGLIEIVNESKTLSDLNKLGISLTNYILNNNNDLSVDKVRTNFLNSLAFYSIVCYILGLGDRHLDNIMITKQGLLFHIDFSFILGNDPKKNIAPEIRITQQMIEVLGGNESKYYEQFQRVCRKSFIKIKHYFHSYYELLLPITDISDDYSKIKIQNFLKGRFMTDLTYSVADIKFNNQVLLDKNSQSQLIDYIHSYGVYKNGITNLMSDQISRFW